MKEKFELEAGTLQQIGLRLDSEILERLNAYAKKRGMDRTSCIRMAINDLLDGASSPPKAALGVSGVDQPARDGLTKLAAKVNLLGAVQVKLQERLDALEAKKEEPASVPFELDL